MTREFARPVSTAKILSAEHFYEVPRELQNEAKDWARGQICSGLDAYTRIESRRGTHAGLYVVSEATEFVDDFVRNRLMGYEAQVGREVAKYGDLSEETEKDLPRLRAIEIMMKSHYTGLFSDIMEKEINDKTLAQIRRDRGV